MWVYIVVIWLIFWYIWSRVRDYPELQIVDLIFIKFYAEYRSW